VMLRNCRLGPRAVRIPRNPGKPPLSVPDFLLQVNSHGSIHGFVIGTDEVEVVQVAVSRKTVCFLPEPPS
jgi:hypothetical protein